uniref:CCHC-type domain-containing protein n=1 Tax=Fagus sylvatica TaxID=28930 RepID=A0A2N9H5H6_FAGSY
MSRPQLLMARALLTLLEALFVRGASAKLLGDPTLCVTFIMAEELEELCRRMQLSDTERHYVNLRKDPIGRSSQEAQYSVLFKLLTYRPFNVEAFKGSIRALWTKLGGLTIRDIDDNLFLAVFKERDDMERIFVQSPWTFDKKLVQIVRFEGDLQPTAVKFKHSAFWIRVFNLPIKSMIREVGEDIGRGIGRLVEVDVPENGLGWAEDNDGGSQFWVDFKYEHLPIFCYRCGIIGHSRSDCVATRRNHMAQSDEEHLSSTSGARAAAPADNSQPVPQVEVESSGADSGTKPVGQTFRDVEESIIPTAVEDEVIQVEMVGEVFPEPYPMDFQTFTKEDKDGSSWGNNGQGSGYIRGDKDKILGDLVAPHKGRRLHEGKHVGNDIMGPKPKEKPVYSYVALVSFTRPSTWKKRARMHASVEERVLDPHQDVNVHGKRAFVGDVSSVAAEITEPSLKRRQLSGVKLMNFTLLCKKEGPNIVFLMETRLPVRSLEWLRVRLGMRACLGVERNGIGTGGGLALLWDSTLQINIQSYSPHHIDADVVQPGGLTWRLTGFYGHPERTMRSRSWNLLRHLHALQARPWLDLGYIGADFTWTNGRYDGGLVRVRLDHCVANEDWIQLFSGATNSHLSVASSDHMALLLDSRENIQPIPPIRHRRNLFRFEKSWLREQGCEDTIAAAWDIHPISTAMFRVTQKIKQCYINILQWSQSLVKATPCLIDSKQRELEELEMCQSEDYDVQANIDEVTRASDSVFTPTMNNTLLCPFLEAEVRIALFQMHPSKAPGPDEGLSALLRKAERDSLLRAGLCAEISSMATRFWWGQKDGERKIHWLSKQKLMKAKKEGGIEFRDIALFNKTLLAKQAWRLLQNPASLVFRMFKAKYFPHTPFLEATVPHNASYLWRSICDSIVVLKAGLRWRVGNGETIKIWRDKWLPCPTTYSVISPRQALKENATVDSLIDRDTMQWRSELLDRVFLPRDAEVIRAIPLSARQPRDCLIWAGTKKGIFTVKSAYDMLLSQAQVSEASTSSPFSGENHLWSSIWSASVPPKIITFMWRACKDILPTQTKLFDKGCIHTFTCLWCGEEAETRDHVLWQCDFLESGQLLNENFCGGSLACPRWQFPGPNRYKLNVAYSLSPGNVQAGLGVLMRDSSGSVAAAMCTRVRWDGEVLQVHARSLLMALQFAYDVGLRALEVDVGCQELLGLISRGSPCFASMRVLIDDICLWHLSFDFLSFSFIEKSVTKRLMLWLQRLCPHTWNKFGWKTNQLVYHPLVQFDSLQ